MKNNVKKQHLALKINQKQVLKRTKVLVGNLNSSLLIRKSDGPNKKP